MAEKHTHSILESIKKKLNKFDQKNDGATSQLSEDLDYSNSQDSFSPKNESADLPSNNLDQVNLAEDKKDDFLPDLKLDNDDELVDQEAQKQIQPSANQSQNEHGLEDIDWDDEVSMKPVVEKVKSGAEPKNNLENFGQNDLEGFESEIESDDVSQEKSDDFLNEIGLREKSGEADLDLILNDLPSEKNELESLDLPFSKPVSNNDLSLDDLDLEMKEFELKQQADIDQSAASSNEDSLDELDEFEQENHDLDEEVEDDSEALNLDLDFNEAESPISKPLADEIDFSEEETLPEEEALPEEQNIDEESEELSGAASEDDLDNSESEVDAANHNEANKRFYAEQLVDEDDDDDLDLYDFELDEEPVKNDKFIEEEVDQHELEPNNQEEVEPLESALESNLLNMPRNNFFGQENALAESSRDKNNRQGLVLDEVTVKQTTDSVKKLLDAKNIISGVSSFSQSPMLAELATQLLEPKLEKWLNSNLSDLVEKIVREEIKKLFPRGE